MAAYMLLRIGWISQRIRRYLRLFHLRQYFNGKKIRRILKLYGLFVHNMIFLLLQTGVCRDLFRHVIAEIPDGKKMVTSAFLTRMRLHNRARAHGYVCAWTRQSKLFDGRSPHGVLYIDAVSLVLQYHSFKIHHIHKTFRQRFTIPHRKVQCRFTAAKNK